MKPPQPAPSWQQILEEKQSEFNKALGRADFHEAVRKSWGERYPYWDELKYWPTPAGLSPELVWSYRELTAVTARKYLPLQDVAGKVFSFWLPDSAQECLHYIDKHAAGPVLSDGRLIHSKERYIARSLTDEAIASSQIEGAATTREAARRLLQSGRLPVDKSERMIVNNYRAIERIRELKDASLTTEAVLELHAILTAGTLPDEAAGRLRQSPQDDDIVVEDADGAILHRPPKGETLPGRLEAFLTFANAEQEASFIHPVIKAIILHFWIGYDHPFIDGNGRTARAVFYWHLLRRDYWLFEYISISQIVKRTDAQYRRAYLHSEAPGGDLTYFIMYNLRVIRLAIKEQLQYIERKSAELERAGLTLRRLPDLNHRQRELLVHALKNPGHRYTIKTHQSLHQTAYQTARTDLIALQKKGFLEAVKDGRLLVYLPTARVAEALKTF